MNNPFDLQADPENTPEGFYDESPLEPLWFLPEEDAPIYVPPLPRETAAETAQVAVWEAAQATLAVPLARTAARLGALDERLLRGPEGWRHRLALAEAAQLSWLGGGRVSQERLGLWLSLHMSATDEDTVALNRAAWAFRRLSGGPGPEGDLAAFLARAESEGGVPLSERAAGWTAVIGQGALHPISRAGFAYHLWPMSDIGVAGDRFEGAVLAARLAVADGQGGASFAPVNMGMTPAGKEPKERLAAWIDATEQGALRALRALDALDAWEQRARAATLSLSGQTPPRLIDCLRDWPFVSAAMAETLTGKSRAAIQRNIAAFEALGLVREVTGQGRFRVWAALALHLGS